ncbi:leucine-rich repeat, immunoglobulin-like domain and transmembrane domain-containing protein 3a [Alosa sapidissima]|uniref:leucine-rich repeat, immunoglobulin-like domain and transmembrane domain-containing protein 3a n=1 Tax=Alosa sapidissima TaxID=34773 RepID=UPI001C097818|nr:leucine-rich repeat, immunoglobulin-like domain and transmembrane domain-containing protein 3a [Alosa sapidissima]
MRPPVSCHRLRLFLFLAILLFLLGPSLCFCPSQCTCVFHGRADGTGFRSVLCNDQDMSDIPVNVPVDTVKLRVEKTAVRRIPSEAFYYLPELRYLWVTYNNIISVDTASFYNLKVLHELRLDGNAIASFPWESLPEMPSLRTLDLHNNRLTSIPAEATPYLVNITYLDISSNKLAMLPSDLLDLWPPFSGVLPSTNDTRVVLGLQDNPWYCDCKISKIIELSKMAETPIVLMDAFLACSGPENLAGVLFQRAELDQCVKPSVQTSATKITSQLGSNVLLRCDATGKPTPDLTWTRADGSPFNHTVVQESPGEGVRWSIIGLNGILYKDSGDYRCKAKNVAGNAEAYITVSVAGEGGTTPLPPQITPRSPEGDASRGSTTALTGPTPLSSPSSSGTTSTTTATTITTTTTTTTLAPTTTTPKKGLGPGGGIQRSPPAASRKGGMGGTAENDKNRKKPVDAKPGLVDIQVVEETVDSAVVVWTAEGMPGDAPVSILCTPTDGGEGGEEETRISTHAGRGKELLENLTPGQSYKVCLATKATAPGKEQCVDFTTLGDGESPMLVIVSGIACVLVVPLILLLTYKIVSLYCRGSSDRGGSGGDSQEDLSKESYVKFETLTMKQRPLNGHVPSHDLWSRRYTESERMLLCSRSSIDSQMTYKSDSSRSEYLC